MARPVRNEYGRAVCRVMAGGNQGRVIGHDTRASQAVGRPQRNPGRKLERLKRLPLEAEVDND
jgi:hypothetical protein